MADSKVVDLIEDTSPLRTDLVYKVDAAGTVDRKMTLAHLLGLVAVSDVSGLGALALLNSLAHSATTGVTTDDHHAKSHVHLSDGSGTVAYSSLSGLPTLGTAASHATTDYDAAGAAAAAQSASQPLDSDLTAIAALATTSFGRSLLTQADAATARTTLGITSTFGNLRVLSADATLLDTYSITYVDYIEVGSGFVLELASDSVMEILT